MTRSRTTPVEISIEALADGVDEALLEEASSVCRWIRPPATWAGDRCGWDRTPPDVAGRTGIRALKFKGLGQAPRAGAPARLPSDEVFDRWPGQPPDPHFGIGADTEFRLLLGDPAPIGGLRLVGAHREYACARDLVASAVPSVHPILVAQYDGQLFDDGAGASPLGVAVTGSPVEHIHRASICIPAPGDTTIETHERSRVATALAVDVDPLESKSPLLLLAAVYRAFGASLAGFSAAGWYRYSGHPGNLVVDDDGRVLLVDLDSSRPADPNRPDLMQLEAARDGMSALYNLACTFFLPHTLDSILDDDLLENEPFSAFLDGWVGSPSAEHEAIGRAIALYVVESRTQLRHFGAFLRSPTEAGSHLYRHVRHDRDLTFIWLYRIAFRLGRPTSGLSMAELDDRLLRFAGRERFERMLVLDAAPPR